MAMNPQNVLSSLRMMSDQQLQQYAAMHKNDPFIFPLAFQESQTRKQMRSESQAMQPPAPKVVDQDLAEMAPAPMPEEVGIGALPAQNLEGMCGGGIVAFDEGGEVPRYNGQTGSWIDRLPEDAWLRKMAENYRQGRPLLDIQPPRAAAPAAAVPPMQMGSNLGATDASLGAAGVAALNAGNAGAASGAQGSPTPPPPAPPAAPLAMPPQAAAPKAPSIEDAKKLSGQFIDQEGIMKSINDFNKMQDEGLAALAKAREEGKPEGKAYQEYERLVKNRADELASDKETAKGEALLTAGLAVLGGSSPFALQNLSLASKGVEQYRDAMKDIKKAARENEKAMADIEQARRAEGREDWKEAQQYKDKAFDRQMKGREMGVTALMNLGIKDGEIASRAYDTAVQTNAAMERTLVQERGQTARTNAMIGAPSGIEKIVDRMGRDPKFAENLRNYMSIGPEMRGESAMLQQYMKNPILFKAQNPQLAAQFEAMLAQRAMPGVMSTPTGQVRD
jgi:tetratricopeptide (TPR) repeat protein